MKKILSLSLIIILTFAGCKKDPGNPPLLPPAESMTIDFTNFTATGKGAELPSVKGTENSNWELAAFVAGTWNLIIGVTLFVPVASFKLTVDQPATYISNKMWEWKYSATIAGIVYKTRLTGQIVGEKAEWKMYITKEGEYTDFLWFEGTSALDGKSGQWLLYESKAVPVRILQIDWTKPTLTTGSVKYSYIKDGATEKGSYIEYVVTGNSPYNASYTIHYYNSNQAKFSDMLVDWSTTGHQGRVKCQDCFGNDQYRCWDSNLVNATCN